MIVLHGTWKPPEKLENSGDFFIWGESSSVPPVKQRGRPSKVSIGRLGMHPFQASDKDILSTLESLNIMDGGVIAKNMHKDTAFLLLPSYSKSPQPSPDLLRDEESDKIEEKVILLQWQVKGLGIPPEEAVLILSSLSKAWNENSSIVVGMDLRFWSKVEKFTM